MKEKKIFINKKTKQMSVVLPRIKCTEKTIKFTSENFEARVTLKRRKK